MEASKLQSFSQQHSAAGHLPVTQRPHFLTCLFSAGPIPQVPVTPKTTFPAPKTPPSETEETTESFKGGPTPQVPVRPKPTFPAPKTPPSEPEEATESFKGGPTPQVPVRSKTTFPAPKTPPSEPEEATESFKGGPTPQVPVTPKTTFPAPKTPPSEPEEITGSFKGGPTPQVPVTPKTTFPAPKTPPSEPEEITESFKGGPTPQVPVRPKPTFPAPKTPPSEPEETTESFKGENNGGSGPETEPSPTPDSEQGKCPQGSNKDYDDQLEHEEEEEEGITSPSPTPDSEQILTQGPQKVCYTRWFNQDDPEDSGDYELTAAILYRNPSEMCSLPKAIEVQAVDGTPASETRQKFAVNKAKIGFICLNIMQGKGCHCRDYRVRFLCPQAFCSDGQEIITPPVLASTLEQVQSTSEVPVKGGRDQMSPGPNPTIGQAQSTPQSTVQGWPP
ncbi:proteoglycan 4-like [Candoia aspera]|uniref:proteoglycan 4-like n=1 Tax=Candoia aspera TaxID=51853 RepID=UPI002FD82FDF